jgi:hypothetical protein
MSGTYIAPNETYCLFGANGDTKSARSAEIRRNDERLFAAMRECLDPAFEAQSCAVFLRQDAQLQNVIGAGGHTRPFAFALISINDRGEDTWALAA